MECTIVYINVFESMFKAFSFVHVKNADTEFKNLFG